MRLSLKRLRKLVDCDRTQMFDRKQADSGMVFVCLLILSIIHVCVKPKGESDKNSECAMSQSVESGPPATHHWICHYFFFFFFFSPSRI